MEALRPWHIVIVAVFFVLLFGAKRLPAMARSLGRSVRIIKSELEGLRDDPEATTSPAEHSAEPPGAPTRDSCPTMTQGSPTDAGGVL